jgi:hypothetical protein
MVSTIAESVVARLDEAIQAGHGKEDMAAVYRAARPDESSRSRERGNIISL